MAAEQPLFTLICGATGFSIQTSIAHEGFQWSKGANFHFQDIMNRSAPAVVYSHSDTQKLDVTLELVAFGAENNSTTIQQAVAGLQALVYPMVPGISPPPLCTITIMGVYLTASNQPFTCVCTNVSPHVGVHNLYSPDAPMIAQVRCSFAEVSLKNIAATQWPSPKFTQFSIRGSSPEGMKALQG